MWCLTKRRTDVVPLWDQLAQSQSCLSMHLQLPWLPFPGHRGRCDAVASLCACVCHMNELKNVTTVTRTHTHTQLWHAGSLPYPVLSQNPLSKTIKGAQMWTWTSQHTEAHRDVQKSTGSSLCTHRPMRVKRSANHERKRGVKGRWGNIGKFC